MAVVAHFSNVLVPRSSGSSRFRVHGCLHNDSNTFFQPNHPSSVSSANSRIQLTPGSRRSFLLLTALSLPAIRPQLALGDSQAPDGFNIYEDQFDGYSFAYPQSWFQVRGAGADVFFRSPVNLDESVMVDVSSPSSSRFESIEDLGAPKDAAKGILKQYLTEFMSTRLGVRRESRIVSSGSRVSEDGRLFYEVQVNVKSFANNNQLAVAPKDRVAQLEWDRRYLSVLGVENNRLYQLRLQTPERTLQGEEPSLRAIMDSFRLTKLDT